MPVPALVKSKAPLAMPLTVSRLVELFVQVWLPPKATPALIVTAAAPEFTVRPPSPSVSVPPPPAMVTLFVLVGEVPRIVRLLIEKFVPSVVLKFDVAFEVVKKTSVPESGSAVLVVPAASEYQLVKPLVIVFQVF